MIIIYYSRNFFIFKKLTTMNTKLIKLFNVALEDSQSGVDVYELNSLAIRCGYIIDPKVCNKSTLEFVNELQANYNSTFYKCWEDVTNSSRESLLIDQLLHYASTYGTNFDPNVCWTPNDNPIEIPYTQYEIIRPISLQDLQSKCVNMLMSGIALSKNTLDALVDFVIEYNCQLDVNGIVNKEAQAMFAAQTNNYPNDKFAILRCLIYNATGSTLLIKDKESIIKIKNSNLNLEGLTEVQLVELSKIFRRFKPLFLAMRNNDNNKKIINKIRRLSDKNHQPFTIGFWESVLSAPYYNTIKDIRNRVGEINNFKIIQLIQACRERLLSTSYQAPQLYKIRNNKVWMKDKEYPLMENKIYYWESVIDILYGELIERLKSKACAVKFPEHLVLTCPSSEKNFIGNIPFGSYFEMQDKNYIGIYWRGEWGTEDFDLSAITQYGSKVGWNSRYCNKGLVYSGDMTSANPEAAEYLSCQNNCEDSIIYVNRFYGEPNSKFRLLYGQESDYIRSQNYMVDPNTLYVKEDIESESSQQMIGCILDNKMYLMNLRLSESRVSGNTFHNMNGKLLSILSRKRKCYLNLKTLLLKAGFKERKKDTKGNPISLDLTNLNKDTLIELFS